ncbi:restriction endonuclease subunit S [Micromonospora sp. WMMD1128]|uniref:restriction endonuclease subunit S n=1 Tax=Micromonospora sp. WMMD1128 TaxID=3015150 RepID=UPI00248AA4AA|nr:restriction endonuclease subunit S [Micromonospora sp. WMMD1128]WBB73793.1 restriction endonuclease subunit S [Micromonospora sp. WMMD1128]
MNIPLVPVHELAEQIRGVTYAKDEASSAPAPDRIPILRAGNIKDHGLDLSDLIFVPEPRVAEKQKIRPYDVIVATSSGSLDVVGKAAQARQHFSGSFGAFCKVLRPNSRIDPRYFAHYFRTPAYRARISSLAAGANINNLRTEHLADLEIPLPSFNKQRTIAEALDQADELRLKRRAALAHLDDLAKSIFINMFGDLRHDGGSFNTVPFSGVVREFRYGTSSKSTSTGYATLRIPNVIGGTLNLDELKAVPATTAEFERLRLTDGDLLFVRTNGNPDFVGRCAVFDQALVKDSGFPTDQFLYASYLIRARVDEQRVLPTFIQQFMSGSAGRSSLRDRCKTSAGQYNLNTAGLGSVQVPVPPLQQQQEFVDRISDVRALRATHESSLAEMDALFASLQDRAFRGLL